MHSADYAVARRLSVRHTPVLCINGYTYPQTFFTIGSPTILVFKRLTLRYSPWAKRQYLTNWYQKDGKASLCFFNTLMPLDDEIR